MSDIDDKMEHNKNMLYYNQMVEKSRRSSNSKNGKQKVKSNSFGSQKINLKDHLFIPDGMEFVAYSFYILVIPYVTGALFLFFTVAGGDMSNFLLLNQSSILIVWAIGYEISATLALLYILSLYVRYDADD